MPFKIFMICVFSLFRILWAGNSDSVCNSLLFYGCVDIRPECLKRGVHSIISDRCGMGKAVWNSCCSPLPWGT